MVKENGKLLPLLASLFIMLFITGCGYKVVSKQSSTSTQQILSEGDAKYKALVHLQGQYPNAELIITGITLKSNNQYELTVRHDALTSGGGGVRFESIACVDAVSGNARGLYSKSSGGC